MREYAQEFDVMAAPLELTDETKLVRFKAGLPEHVDFYMRSNSRRDIITGHTIKETYAQYRERAIEITGRFTTGVAPDFLSGSKAKDNSATLKADGKYPQGKSKSDNHKSAQDNAPKKSNIDRSNFPDNRPEYQVSQSEYDKYKNTWIIPLNNASRKLLNVERLEPAHYAVWVAARVITLAQTAHGKARNWLSAPKTKDFRGNELPAEVNILAPTDRAIHAGYERVLLTEIPFGTLPPPNSSTSILP